MALTQKNPGLSKISLHGHHGAAIYRLFHYAVNCPWGKLKVVFPYCVWWWAVCFIWVRQCGQVQREFRISHKGYGDMFVSMGLEGWPIQCCDV